MSDKLKEIKERWSNATAGPWKWINDGICLFPQNGFDYGDYIVFIQKSGFGNPHDAEAIVKSPTDVSWLIEQLEQAQAERKKLTEIIARNLVAWNTSKDKREGLLPEVYLSNKYMYKQMTGEEYIQHKAIKKFHIGD